MTANERDPTAQEQIEHRPQRLLLYVAWTLAAAFMAAFGFLIFIAFG